MTAVGCRGLLRAAGGVIAASALTAPRVAYAPGKAALRFVPKANPSQALPERRFR
jgi:hypothetical protein